MILHACMDAWMHGCHWACNFGHCNLEFVCNLYFVICNFFTYGSPMPWGGVFGEFTVFFGELQVLSSSSG
jgi:hypothetical protein